MDGIVLGIEHANPAADEPASVAVAVPGSGGTLGRIEQIDVPHGHGERVAATIDAILRQHAFSPADVAEVAVSVGPGGFTSTRIGMVACQMFAWANGVPVRPVPTGLGFAVASGAAGRVDVVLASRRDLVWHEAYSNGESVIEPGLVSAESLTVRGASAVVGPSKVCQWATTNGFPGRVHPMRSTARAIIRASRAISPADPSALRPIYPRKPDALTIEQRTNNT